MLEKILNLLPMDNSPRLPRREPAAWLKDPLAHPDIADMDGRALGDLPFGLYPAPRRPDPCGPEQCGHPA